MGAFVHRPGSPSLEAFIHCDLYSHPIQLTRISDITGNPEYPGGLTWAELPERWQYAYSTAYKLTYFHLQGFKSLPGGSSLPTRPSQDERTWSSRARGCACKDRSLRGSGSRGSGWGSSPQATILRNRRLGYEEPSPQGSIYRDDPSHWDLQPGVARGNLQPSKFTSPAYIFSLVIKNETGLTIL